MTIIKIEVQDGKNKPLMVGDCEIGDWVVIKDFSGYCIILDWVGSQARIAQLGCINSICNVSLIPLKSIVAEQFKSVQIVLERK